MCKGPAAGQNWRTHLRTEQGLVGYDQNLDMAELNVARRMELARKKGNCARSFGPHKELSQEQQEAAKWLS